MAGIARSFESVALLYLPAVRRPALPGYGQGGCLPCIVDSSNV